MAEDGAGEGTGELIELEPEYASRDLIPEDRAGFYRENDDGAFVLNVSRNGSRRLENVDGLRTTLSGVRQKLEKARQREAAQAAELEELRGLKEKKADGDGTKADDARIAQLTEKHNAELSARDGKIEKRTKQLEKLMTQEGILRHMPEGADKETLLPALRGLVRTVEVDGDLVTKVFEHEDSTTPLMSMKEGSTEDMGLKEFMSTIVPKRFKRHILAPNASGGGALGSDGSPGRASGNGEFAISAEDARKPALYRAKKAAAAKAGKVLTIVRS